MRLSKTSWLTVAVGVLVLVTVVASCNVRSGPGSSASSIELPNGIPAEFKSLFEVYLALKQDHIDREELDDAALSEGAIRGMLEALDDPHAFYLDAQLFQLELGRFKGSFEGIGAEVSLREGKFIIVAPLPGTPAERAGIRPGDVILEVDSESTQGMDLFEVVSRIRGGQGTQVDLLIVHRNAPEPVSLTIIRSVINVPTVDLRILTGGVAHLKISTYGETTNEELMEALDKVERFNVKGLILDLRNNPGGLVSATVDATSQFLESGLVLYQVDGLGRRIDMKVKSGGKAQDIPMVVLVNEFSASGSEIMAGAIQDHDRAPLLGAKTFGKGSVNIQLPLSDGSGVYYTIARWYTPNGALIEEEGIEPDIEVLPDPEGVEDFQLDRAIELLRDLISQVG